MLLIIVHRLLQSFIFPPLNVIIIMIIGVSLLCWRKKIGILVITVGLLLLYVQSIPWTANTLAKQIQLAPLDITLLKNSQAIVVLGGGASGNGFEYPHKVTISRSSLIRLNYVAYLARMYPDKIIVLSGGYTGTTKEAEVMRDTLINSFHITSQILIEDKSRNTNENAKFVADILLPLHINNIVLVTQAFHMRRSMMLFKQYGLNPVAASTDYFYSIDANTPVLAFIPQADAMGQVAAFLHEIVGYWIYSINKKP